MRRLRLLLIGTLSFIITLGADYFGAAISVALCGSLSFCSLTSNGSLIALANMPTAQTAGNSRLTGQEIAIPPIIREAPIDLQGAIADDFVVSRQTPYSSGRNEVLIVSPSTGTEQRFEISLPTGDGFRLYEASFSKVNINDPSRVLLGEGTIAPAQIQSLLESFTVSFDSNNLISKVTLADGSRTEFSETEATIRSADGQIVEAVPLLDSKKIDSVQISSAKSWEGMVAQTTPLCESDVGNRTLAASRDAERKSNIIGYARSDVAKLFAWALTFNKRALEDSMVASRRNQTLQDVACRQPIRCNQPRSYNGTNVTQTDLFQLSGGSSQSITISYEFYEIPDRMEIYAQGDLIGAIPETGGSVSGGSSVSFSITDGTEFLGIKLVGNENPGTVWDYTVSCSGRADPLLTAREVARQLREYYPGWNSRIDPCPCLREDLIRTGRFSRSFFFVDKYHPGADTAYRSNEDTIELYPSTVNPDLPPLRPGQQCTYGADQRLITVGEAAGTPDAFAPGATENFSGMHTRWDVAPSEAMTWQEYHQTWTPNNANACPANAGIPPYVPPPGRPWGE